MRIKLLENNSRTVLLDETTELYKNSFDTLTSRFGLEADHAKSLLHHIPENIMQRLWNVYIKLYSPFRQILSAHIGEVLCNVQMLEDLLHFELEIIGNTKRAWIKYQIPTYTEQGRALTIFKANESKIILAIGPELAIDLMQPLKKNLTADCQAEHPNITINSERNIDLFLKYASLEKRQRDRLPAFMYETNGLSLSSSFPANFSTQHLPSLNEHVTRNSDNTENLNFMVVGDFVAMLVALCLLIRLLTPLIRYGRNRFFSHSNTAEVNPQLEGKNPVPASKRLLRFTSS